MSRLQSTNVNNLILQRTSYIVHYNY